MSVRGLSQKHELQRPTVEGILQFLTESDVVYKIFPYATHPNNKLAKYCFTAAGYRSAIFNASKKNKLPNTKIFDEYKGFLLEDIVCLYFNILKQQLGSSMEIYHDYNNGADFIIKYRNKK